MTLKDKIFPVMPISNLQLRRAIGQRSNKTNQIALIQIR